MALNYTTTMKTVTDAALAFSDTMTWTFWGHHPGAFGGSSRVMEQSSNNILPTGASTNIELQRVHATQTGRWEITLGNEGIDTANWWFMAITLDSSDVNNNPIFYVAQEGDDALTTAATVTENAAPIGTVTNASAVMTMANRSDNIRPWDGALAWFCIYNAVLTPEQLYEVGRVGYITDNLVRGYELISTSGAGGENDLSANNGDATGTNTPVRFHSPPRMLATKIMLAVP